MVMVQDSDGMITLYGNSGTRLFDVQSGAAPALRNITVSDGWANGDGGAIINNGALRIDHVRLDSNSKSNLGSASHVRFVYGELTQWRCVAAQNCSTLAHACCQFLEQFIFHRYSSSTSIFRVLTCSGIQSSRSL